MFTLPEYEVLLYALKSIPVWAPEDPRHQPRAHALAMLEAIIEGGGLLPLHSSTPPGPRPDPVAMASATVAMVHQPFVYSLLNTLRSFPNVWADSEVAIGLASHASVAIVKLSKGIDVQKFVRVSVRAFLSLPTIHPALRRAVQAVLDVEIEQDLVTAPGGEA